MYGAEADDGSRIGYDAAVCLELFEPYVVEVYNTTGSLPSSNRIVTKGNKVMSVNDGEQFQRRLFGDRKDVKTELNSTGCADAYEALHGNSVNQVLKDNGRDSFYVPSPTVRTIPSLYM